LQKPRRQTIRQGIDNKGSGRNHKPNYYNNDNIVINAVFHATANRQNRNSLRDITNTVSGKRRARE